MPARVRPKVGGFPYLAEALRAAGFDTVRCAVPTHTMIYSGPAGAAVQQRPAIVQQPLERVPDWDEAALVTAIRTDQAGNSTFPEFLDAS